MKRPSIFFWLLLPPALLLCGFSITVFVLLCQFIPASVGWAVAGIATVIVLWFFLARRRGETLAGSEYSLMGRQSSKEGLL
jgi:hypothetical protein